MPIYIKPKTKEEAKNAIRNILKILKAEQRRIKQIEKENNILIKKGYKIKSIKLLDLSKI